jgi:transposase
MVAVCYSMLKQIASLIAIRRLARSGQTARRLMTVPGVGPVVALAYMSVIDDPGRFDHAREGQDEFPSAATGSSGPACMKRLGCC